MKPFYYALTGGRDLLDVMALLLSHDEMRGYYKGNIFKYITRYNQKNGEEDLDKAITYIERLKKWEYPDE